METHIVFDLDWTITDTQKIHEQIESDFLKQKWVYIEKPNPDVFLETFKKLEDIHWSSDLKYVIWDWWSDMEGWYRAWAKTVWLNYLNKQKLNDIYCNFEIESLKELQDIL